MSPRLGGLKSGRVMGLAGVLLLGVLVWIGGPYLGLGATQPLASVAARVAAILALLLAWAVVVAIALWRERRRDQGLADAMAGADADHAAEAAAAESARLRTLFQQAVDTLRRTRRRGRNLYALPWYAVIGPPGSGKTTLLQYSGLDFPVAAQAGTHAVRGVGGTRDCEWWFADEAVFLDTAGRYTTQDSDAATDASAWMDFLRLLRRYRRRRPLNGVIVSMSVSDLLTLDEAERLVHARAIRRRLDELNAGLKMRVPVYVVLTKCDLVAGFSEFFDDLGPELRSQVWGFTVPVAQTLDGSAAARFGEEFDLLLARLETRVVARLHAERNDVRRAALLSFPQEMGALHALAGAFISSVFGSHQYGDTPLLRGVYFTSGTQEGTPIDRMLGTVARTFGVDASRMPTPAAPRRSFFVERLVKDVILKESGFAGADPASERRLLLLRAGVLLGTAALVVLAIVGMATSYGRNRTLIADVREAMAAFPARADDLARAGSLKVYLARSLQRLEILDEAHAVAARHEGDVPWSMRMGLYRGASLTEAIHDAYRRELNGSLLPAAGVRFRDGLAASARQPQEVYDYLKGYLMLGEPAHLAPAELAALARVEWRRLFPADADVQKALDRHFTALLEAKEKPRALPVDAGLVAQARATLQTADASVLVYDSVRLRAESSGAPPLRLDQSLGLLGNVFHRRSGTPLSTPLPALYTRALFAAEAAGGVDEAVERFVKEDWVFGAHRIDPLARSRITQEVMALYERDYIKAWDDLLADLELQPVTTIQDASAVAARLSGPASPLKALLVVVRDNTSDLLRGPATGKTRSVSEERAAGVGKRMATDRVVSRSNLARQLHDAGAILPDDDGRDDTRANERRPGASIEQHFADLNQLTAGPAGGAPIDRTVGVLDQLGKHLLTMDSFDDATAQADPVLLGARQDASQLPPQVGGMLSNLTGRSQALVASGVSGALGDAFREAAGNDCTRMVDGRYPFRADGSSDIPLQNFAELFGNGGRFDTFFKQKLAPLIDTGGGTWRWKKAATTGPANLPAQAQLADDIRQAYFRGGPQPEVDFTVRVGPLPPALRSFRLVVDGQTLASPSEDAVAMKWPGPKPGQVIVSAEDATGAKLADLDYEGEWAWFHALDAAGVQAQGDLRLVARFTVGGHAVPVTIQPSNLRHPFGDARVRRFRCPG